MNFLKESNVNVTLEVGGKKGDLAGADHRVVVQERTSVPGKNSDRGTIRGETIGGGKRSERRDRWESGRFRGCGMVRRGRVRAAW